MDPWKGWTWSTATAATRARRTWPEWLELLHRRTGISQSRDTFTRREEAYLRFLRWCYDEQRLAS